MKRRSVAIALLLAGCAALFFLQQKKATVPITPRPLLYLVADTQREAERIPLALTRVSDQEEQKAGDQIARDFGLTSWRAPNPDAARIIAYLNDVGLRVSSHVQRKAIRYHFYLENNPYFINAFALPGGHIVVGRGLLELITSDDELAAVLGHEIAHVDDRHSIGRLQYQLASRKLGLGDLYSLGAPAIELFKAGYTKEQELEADRDGLRFAVAAGYSPAGALDLMKRFEKLESDYSERAASPIGEFAQVPFGALVEYFRSHPPASERLAALQKEITANGWNASQPVRPLLIRPIFLADTAERLNARGDFQQSIATLKEAVAIDPRYVRAWQVLAGVSWRSGDAAETASAETEVVQQGLPADRDWQLLARALAISDPKNAAQRFQQILAARAIAQVNPGPSTPAIELDGLRLLHGDKRAAADFKSGLPSTADISALSKARSEIAWWMYRAGQFNDAEQQLQLARQMIPQAPDTSLRLVWVLSDLGRQADATQILDSIIEDPYSQPRHAEIYAARAMLMLRTGQPAQAHQQFQGAAEADPVWMVANWVQNNYSPSAARVISQLQAFESQRRAKSLRQRSRLQSPAPAQ
jgi:beta-barrel assembly-enhancing protease